MLRTVLKYSLFLNLPILKAGTERFFDECEHVKCEFQNSTVLFLFLTFFFFHIINAVFMVTFRSCCPNPQQIHFCVL